MSKIAILLCLFFVVGTTQASADSVETTIGTVYQGTIVKMDENEIVIKTATGVARIPRSRVKSFQSGPSLATPESQSTSSTTQTSTIKEESSGRIGGSAKEAIRALKKLEAKCEAGISYKDYGPALGDAKFEVNLFLESAEAKNKPKLGEAIEAVMAHYEFAATVWRRKVSDRFGNVIAINSELGQTVLKLYPSANKDYREGGALSQFMQKPAIWVDALLSVIWGEATKDLKRATALLSS